MPLVGSQKLAVVTGTTSGIGEAVAAELLRRGWRVLGLARRAAGFEHPDYAHIRLDLGDLGTLADRLDRPRVPDPGDAAWRRVALVNNAADPGLLGPVGQVDVEAMLRAYAVNLGAPVWLMGWVVRRARPGVPVRIVNVSSGAGVSPYPGLGTYGGAKAALRMAGMVMASELALSSDRPRDVTLLSYSPGPVDTPMQATARATETDRFPLREVFRQWATEGRLMPPAVPAAEIVAYLEDDGYPAFHECRSGELRKPELTG